MTEAIVIQAPASGARRLLLLFHGVGAQPRDLVPLGRALAARHPDAFVASVPGAHRSDLGTGFQWFSVRGVTEENRPARVAEAAPAFEAAVREWQQRTGLDAAQTTLIGFSQGAIMALESIGRPPPLASRVVAIAGRFAAAPHVPAAGTRLHFVHGAADPVIPFGHSASAAERLAAAGADVSVDLLPGVGHEIDAQVAEAVLRRLADPRV